MCFWDTKFFIGTRQDHQGTRGYIQHGIFGFDEKSKIRKNASAGSAQKRFALLPMDKNGCSVILHCSQRIKSNL
jgi:hypothetical protein